jgi:hypothetical protein
LREARTARPLEQQESTTEDWLTVLNAADISCAEVLD